MKIPELRFSRCRRCLRQEASFNGRLPLQRLRINAHPAFFYFQFLSKNILYYQNPVIVAVFNPLVFKMNYNVGVCCVPVCVLVSCTERQEKTALKPGSWVLLTQVCNTTQCYGYVF